jgi:hypothetical protein
MLDHIPAYGWVEANSMLYSFVRERAAGKIKAILAAVRGGGDESTTPAPAPNASAVPGTQPVAAPPAPPSYSDRLTVALLAKIQDECGQRGVKFMILDVPTWNSRTWFESQFPHEAAKGAKFDIVSPLAAFKPHLGEKLFWEKGHYHFTILGCQLVGEALSDHILQEKLLDATAATTKGFDAGGAAAFSPARGL